MFYAARTFFQQLSTGLGHILAGADIYDLRLIVCLHQLHRGVRHIVALRGDPTDLRLLLRLSEELPAINRLLQLYLRALDLVRET